MQNKADKVVHCVWLRFGQPSTINDLKLILRDPSYFTIFEGQILVDGDWYWLWAGAALLVLLAYILATQRQPTVNCHHMSRFIFHNITRYWKLVQILRHPRLMHGAGGTVPSGGPWCIRISNLKCRQLKKCLNNLHARTKAQNPNFFGYVQKIILNKMNNIN